MQIVECDTKKEERLLRIQDMEELLVRIGNRKKHLEYRTEELLVMVSEYCRQLPERTHYLQQLEDQWQHLNHRYQTMIWQLEEAMVLEKMKDEPS